VPFLSFAPLRNALVKLEHSSRAYRDALNKLHSGEHPLSLEKQRLLDTILMKTERAMTSSAGLPGRPWYKHQIYAPGFYTGYGVKTLPGVREAIEGRRWSEAEEQIQVLARALENVAAEIDRAAGAASGLN